MFQLPIWIPSGRPRASTAPESTTPAVTIAEPIARAGTTRPEAAQRTPRWRCKSRQTCAMSPTRHDGGCPFCRHFAPAVNSPAETRTEIRDTFASLASGTASQGLEFG